MAKKNPIKKRKQGSLKPNPMSPGDPSKYMGATTDVEQYHEPQGINSPAAKRVMKRESFSDMVDKQMTEMFGGSLGDMGMMTPISGSDGKFAIPDAPTVLDPRAPQKIAGSKAPTKKVKKTVKKSYQNVDYEDELNEDHPITDPGYVSGVGPRDLAKNPDGTLKAVKDLMAASIQNYSEDPQPGKEDWPQRITSLWRQFSKAMYEKDFEAAARAFQDYFMMGQLDKGVLMAGELSEMVRVPIFSLLTSAYEVKDGEKTLGYARVHEGVIAELICTDATVESYRGEVLTQLMKAITMEADMQNSNLSLQLQDKDDDDMKRFMERWGFKDIGHGVMRRTAGSVQPPSVHYSDGMDGM